MFENRTTFYRGVGEGVWRHLPCLMQNFFFVQFGHFLFLFFYDIARGRNSFFFPYQTNAILFKGNHFTWLHAKIISKLKNRKRRKNKNEIKFPGISPFPRNRRMSFDVKRRTPFNLPTIFFFSFFLSFLAKKTRTRSFSVGTRRSTWARSATDKVLLLPRFGIELPTLLLPALSSCSTRWNKPISLEMIDYRLSPPC